MLLVLLGPVSSEGENFRGQLEDRIRRYARIRDEIQAQLLELNHSLNTTEKRLHAAVEMFRLEYGQDPASVPGLPAPETVAPRKKQRQNDGSSWNDAVIKALTAAGQPLHLNDLWRKIAASGFETEAKDPLRALASVLVRHPDVHRTGPNTYGLESLPGPQESLEGLAAVHTAPPTQEGEAA
jgi:hypothetical protein